MSTEVCLVPVGMSGKQFKDFRKNVSTLVKKISPKILSVLCK